MTLRSTTPEKWDAVGRRLALADRRLINSVGLLMVDEIHLLNEVPRGATLEGLLSRSMLRQQEAQPCEVGRVAADPIAHLRIIGLSATAPNAREVADWLHAKVSHIAHPLDMTC